MHAGHADTLMLTLIVVYISIARFAVWLVFQNYKLSNTYYAYIYGVQILFFKILPKNSSTRKKVLLWTEHGITITNYYRGGAL